MICFDNEFKYLTYEILDYTEELDYDLLNYIASNISMLGMYLSYLETQGIKYKVECKPNNKFYINKSFEQGYVFYGIGSLSTITTKYIQYMNLPNIFYFSND